MGPRQISTVKGDVLIGGWPTTDTGVRFVQRCQSFTTGRSTMGVKVMRLDQMLIDLTTVAAVAEKEEVGTEIETEGEA